MIYLFLFSILNQIYLFSLFWYAVFHDSMQNLVIGKFGTIFLGAKQLYIKTLLLLGLWLRTQEKKWSRQMNNATSQIRSADWRGRKWETILLQTVLLIDVSWTQSHTYGEKVRKWERELVWVEDNLSADKSTWKRNFSSSSFFDLISHYCTV